jgi:hypothetical protein
MDNRLKLIVGFLTIATAVLAMATAYVVGVEQDVNSQQPEITEFRQLNPDVLINPLPYTHPLRNVLYGYAVSIGICWIALFMYLREKKAHKTVGCQSLLETREETR